ncbi:MAG: hypothetical protein SPK71_02070 [Prevotella sp.]|nr:hypothetical protein [Prevotella sp.]
MKKLITLISLVTFSLSLMAQPTGRKKAYDDYGELVSIFSEDFSKMTTGEVGAPDFATSVLMDLGQYEYPWWNVKPEFTNQEHWGGINIWSAGGTVYLEATNDMGGARLSLPNVDGTAHGGKVIFRFKARTDDGQVCSAAYVEAGETNNMGKEWRLLPHYSIGEITDEWKTYEFLYDEVGPSTIFIIGAEQQYAPDKSPIFQDFNPIYIDDVELLQIDQIVETPELLPHSNYEGHGEYASFQANWKAVDGAESYLLSVFTKDNQGNKTYFLEEQAVNGTSYVVEGVASGQVYYYEVSSVKGENVSLPSAPMMVEDIANPENLKSTEIVDGKYTASWDAVPTAEAYNYVAYFETGVEEDTEFAVTDESMDYLRFPENPSLGDRSGAISDLTDEEFINQVNYYRNGDYASIDEIYFQSFDTYYLKDFKQYGWYATHALPMRKCLKVDGWFYQYGAGDAGLISPALDLSKNNGEFDLSVKTLGIIDEFENLTSCAVALFTYDETKGDYTQQELVYVDQKAEAWQENNLHFTKGAENSIIGLYAVRGAEALLLDDLKITQNYKAGEKFLDPFFSEPRYFDTTIDVVLPSQVVDADVYHRVQAIRTKASTNPNKDFDEIISDFSNMEYVGKGTSTGICTPAVSLTNATVQLRNGQLVVNNANAGVVEVYTLAGEKVYSDRSGNTTVNVPVKRGTYVVKAGNQTVKVVF